MWESATAPDGSVTPASGWTDLVISAARPVRVVTGLTTGGHEFGDSYVLLP